MINLWCKDFDLICQSDQLIINLPFFVFYLFLLLQFILDNSTYLLNSTNVLQGSFIVLHHTVFCQMEMNNELKEKSDIENYHSATKARTACKWLQTNVNIRAYFRPCKCYPYRHAWLAYLKAHTLLTSFWYCGIFFKITWRSFIVVYRTKGEY